MAEYIKREDVLNKLMEYGIGWGDAKVKGVINSIPAVEPPMTVERLKTEAKKLGYRIIPEPESIRLLPCTCGHNGRTHWWTSAGEFYECQKCGRSSPEGKNETEARRLWNKMVEEENGRSKEV